MKQKEQKPIHPLRLLRKKHSLTQAELSNLLDRRAGFVALIEGGFSELPRQVFFNICTVFNLDHGKLEADLQAYKSEMRKYLLAKIKEN